MIIQSQIKSIERLKNENIILKSNPQIKSDSKNYSNYSKALNRRIHNQNLSINKKSLSNMNVSGNNSLVYSNSLKKLNRPLSSLTKSGSASLLFNKK